VHLNNTSGALNPAVPDLGAHFEDLFNFIIQTHNILTYQSTK
jgi:hypothetical protein